MKEGTIEIALYARHLNSNTDQLFEFKFFETLFSQSTRLKKLLMILCLHMHPSLVMKKPSPWQVSCLVMVYLPLYGFGLVWRTCLYLFTEKLSLLLKHLLVVFSALDDINKNRFLIHSRIILFFFSKTEKHRECRGESLTESTCQESNRFRLLRR